MDVAVPAVTVAEDPDRAMLHSWLGNTSTGNPADCYYQTPGTPSPFISPPWTPFDSNEGAMFWVPGGDNNDQGIDAVAFSPPDPTAHSPDRSMYYSNFTSPESSTGFSLSSSGLTLSPVMGPYHHASGVGAGAEGSGREVQIGIASAHFDAADEHTGSRKYSTSSTAANTTHDHTPTRTKRSARPRSAANKTPANRSRAKTQAAARELETTERGARVRNTTLIAEEQSLQNQIYMLKNELLLHANCCPMIQRYLTTSAERISNSAVAAAHDREATTVLASAAPAAMENLEDNCA